jgi:hypothetical protein
MGFIPCLCPSRCLTLIMTTHLAMTPWLLGVSVVDAGVGVMCSCTGIGAGEQRHVGSRDEAILTKVTVLCFEVTQQTNSTVHPYFPEACPLCPKEDLCWSRKSRCCSGWMERFLGTGKTSVLTLQ